MIGFIAAGVAILTGVQARLAAILLTVMVAVLHRANTRADACGGSLQTRDLGENALNLALIGAAWVVADQLAQPRRQQAVGDLFAKHEAAVESGGFGGNKHQTPKEPLHQAVCLASHCDPGTYGGIIWWSGRGSICEDVRGIFIPCK